MTVNGKEIRLEDTLTLAEYLERSAYQIGRVAVERNGCIVPRTDYSKVILEDGDVLEVVSFVGGG